MEIHMNAVSLFLRLGALAAMLFVLTLMASPEVHAQDSPERLTIIVAKSVDCDVALEYTGGNVALLCSPGTTTVVRGSDPVFIYNCHGVLVQVGNLFTPCTIGIPITETCCVDACLSYDQQGRPVVSISRGLCTCSDGDID
jgi:hypothetical protein